MAPRVIMDRRVTLDRHGLGEGRIDDAAAQSGHCRAWRDAESARRSGDDEASLAKVLTRQHPIPGKRHKRISV